MKLKLGIHGLALVCSASMAAQTRPKSEGEPPAAFRARQLARRAVEPPVSFVPGCFLHMQGVLVPRSRMPRSNSREATSGRYG